MATLCILVACVLSDTPVIRWQDAPEYMNKTVTVRMKVVRSSFSGKFDEVAGYLFPSDSKTGMDLSVYIDKSADPKRQLKNGAYEGKTVEVTGKIVPQNPKYLVPRMRVTDLSQIRIVEDEE